MNKRYAVGIILLASFSSMILASCSNQDLTKYQEASNKLTIEQQQQFDQCIDQSLREHKNATEECQSLANEYMRAE